MRELDFIVQDIEVEVELTGIFGFAFAALELNGDKTLEMAVNEQQILEDLLKFAQCGQKSPNHAGVRTPAS